MKFIKVILHIKDKFGSKIKIQFYPHRIGLTPKSLNFYYGVGNKVIPVNHIELKRIDIKEVNKRL